MRSNFKDFDCKKCSHKHCDADRALPGSRGAAPFDLYAIENVITTNVCLLPMVSDLSRDLLALANHYHGGHFPFSGGLLDQPNLYLEAMELIPNGICSSQ